MTLGRRSAAPTKTAGENRLQHSIATATREHDIVCSGEISEGSERNPRGETGVAVP